MTDRQLHWLGIGALLASGCLPEFDVRNSEIERERVLAVVAEPAEARPGALVRYEALVVSPEGRVRTPELGWTHCVTPKPLVGNNSSSPECAYELGLPLLDASEGLAEGRLPLDACARFGPDPPPGDARPRDPDLTGGFFQPVRLDTWGGAWIHFQRTTCNPRNAPADIARAFSRDYVSNRNPHITAVTVSPPSGDSTDGVDASSVLDVSIEWPPEDAEVYSWIDPRDSSLIERREGMLASWFATAGGFASDRTPVDEEAKATTTSNRWSAPAEPQTVILWIVLRDSRGGSAFVERTLRVR